MDKTLAFDILSQPDDETCGPTCLHAVYRYFGEDVSLESIIQDVPRLPEGGTLAVLMGLHALSKGYRATLYSANLLVFDPTWFIEPKVDLPAKLSTQAAAKDDEKLKLACDAYSRFVQAGGVIHMTDLEGRLIRKFLDKDVPVITGTSSTYLYQSKRELPGTTIEDDIRGVPTGHFVVLSGYDRQRKEVRIADPFPRNPARSHTYTVSMNRVINAVLLGIVTYDANLLIIQPPKSNVRSH